MTPPVRPFHSMGFDFSLPQGDMGAGPTATGFGHASAGPSMSNGDGQTTVSLADLIRITNGHAGPVNSLPPPDVMPSFFGEGPIDGTGLSGFKGYTLPESSTYPAPSPYAQSSNPRPLQPPDPNFNFDFGLLDPTMVDLSTELDLSASFTTFSNEAELRPAEDPLVPSPGLSSGSATLSSVSLTHTTRQVARRELIEKRVLGDEIAAFRSRAALSDHSAPNTAASGGIETRTDEEWQDSIEQDISSRVLGIPAIGLGNNGLTGGWFDPDDVPPGVRDHL